MGTNTESEENRKGERERIDLDIQLYSDYRWWLKCRGSILSPHRERGKEQIVVEEDKRADESTQQD